MRSAKSPGFLLLAMLCLWAPSCGGGGGGGGGVVGAAPPPPVECGNTSWPASLPQDHEYQLVLREYMSCLSVEDFEVEVRPFTYDAAYLTSIEDIHRTFLVMENQGRAKPPDGRGFLLHPSHFVLSSIEAEGKVNMRVGRGRWIDAADTAWWSQWNYAGNPYLDSRALRLRAFVAAAVDMMMLDSRHDKDANFSRSDFLGGSMIGHAYTYHVVKDELPLDVQLAFETGLLREFDKLERWGPEGVFGDIDTFAVVAMFYIVEALGDESLRARAQAWVKDRLFPKIFREAGYIYHGGGYDPSYHGISFRFLLWAALLAKWPWLTEKLEKMLELKAHLTLPEPSGDYFGPSHFATANVAGAPLDQWATYWRDVAAGMVSEKARYLAWGARHWPGWYVTEAPDETTMRKEIAKGATWGMSQYRNSAPISDAPGTWSAYHWTDGINYAHDLYVPGTYAALRALQDEGSPEMVPPLERGTELVRAFGDEFLVARLGDFAVVIHTGPLSTWGGKTTQLSGFGGGALSAFWTPATGSVLLGKNSGLQSGKADKFTEWRTWPTHAISGQTSGGKPFSSARHKSPTRTYTTGTDTARVVVSGRLDDEFSGPDDAFLGAVTYERSFDVSRAGVTVTSTVVSDQQDFVSELYDVLPVFKNDTVRQGQVTATISFLVNGTWTAGDTTLQEGVTAIRIERFDGTVYVELDGPRRVRLSSADWTSDHQVWPRVRNVLIDLLGQDGSVLLPASTSVSYTFKTSLD